MEEEYKNILKQRIDEVLHYLWDPIAVRDTPEARDEYASYADKIWHYVLEGKSKPEVSNYLTSIITEQMGFRPSKEHDDEITDIILEWDRFLKRYYEL